MKILSITILLIMLFGCSPQTKLNNAIYKAQVNHLKYSSYNKDDIRRVKRYDLNAQKKFRSSVLFKEALLNDYWTLKNDTIVLIEAFDNICLGCPASWFSMVLNDSIYRYSDDALTSIYLDIENTDINGYAFDNSAQIEVVKNLRSDIDWNAYPLEYGAKDCFDGEHTIITIIYPVDKIESMYIRCWIPKHQRLFMKSTLN